MKAGGKLYMRQLKNSPSSKNFVLIITTQTSVFEDSRQYFRNKLKEKHVA